MELYFLFLSVAGLNLASGEGQSHKARSCFLMTKRRKLATRNQKKLYMKNAQNTRMILSHLCKSKFCNQIWTQDILGKCCTPIDQERQQCSLLYQHVSHLEDDLGAVVIEQLEMEMLKPSLYMHPLCSQHQHPPPQHEPSSSLSTMSLFVFIRDPISLEGIVLPPKIPFFFQINIFQDFLGHKLFSSKCLLKF
jgi:hypothetical protein